MRGQRFVILSDLHMGNGGSRDDFRKNGNTVSEVLWNHYYRQGYHLVLNGDIEELQKFQLPRIQESWSSLYSIFDSFHSENRMTKLFGNHDLLLADPPEDYPYPVHESMEICNDRGSLLVYHGHQFSNFLMRYEKLCRYVLKYIAYPLGIMNYSKSPASRKKLKTEIQAYQASCQSGLISIIGHTHRPLFESLSKSDSLKYRLDSLIRSYREKSELEQKRVEREIKLLQHDLKLLRNSTEPQISEIYSSDGLIPCLFNSGCTIGKRGFTAIEVDDRNISLVYWYDSDKQRQYSNFYGYGKLPLPGSSLTRITLNSENLSYIQDKVRFMAPQPSPFVTDTPVSFQLLQG